MTLGRPTSYRPEYPEMLVEHMAKGFSFASFGGVVRVGMKTLYEWEKNYPAFQQAKEIGQLACLQAWEKISLAASLGKTKPVAAIVIYNMRARFSDLGWDVTDGKNRDSLPATIPLAYETPQLKDAEVIDV